MVSLRRIKSPTPAFFYLLLVCNVFPFHSSFSLRAGQRQRKCAPVTIPACRKIGYNMTQVLDMYSPIARSIDKGRKYIEMIEKTRCSNHAVFLLCTVYSPVCFKDQDLIVPCQSTCYRVKRKCNPLMKKYGIEWPEELDCPRFPEHNTGVCIQPSSFLSSEKAAQQKESKGQEKRTKCVCKKSAPRFTKFRHYKKAAFIIEGTILSRATTAHGRTKIYVNVTKIIKYGKVKPQIGKNKIMSPTTCVCPKFQFDVKYIMFGSENVKKRRLTFDTSDRLLPLKIGQEKIRRWAAKCKKRKC